MARNSKCSKLLGRDGTDKAFIAQLRDHGERPVQLTSIIGSKGAGKSTVAGAMTDGRVDFPTGNSHEHTTRGIDVALYDRGAQHPLCIFLDTEGLLKGDASKDMHLLTLLAALAAVTRHIYLAIGSVFRPDLDCLAALSLFSQEHRQGMPALCVGLRTHVPGPLDAATQERLLDLFGAGNATIVRVATASDRDRPLEDAGYRASVAELAAWALAPGETLPARAVADVLDHLVDAAGALTPVPSLVDHHHFGTMDNMLNETVKAVQGERRESLAQVAALVQSLTARTEAVLRQFAAKLTPDGRAHWEAKARATIQLLEVPWQIAAAECEMNAAYSKKAQEANRTAHTTAAHVAASVKAVTDFVKDLPAGYPFLPAAVTTSWATTTEAAIQNLATQWRAAVAAAEQVEEARRKAAAAEAVAAEERRKAAAAAAQAAAAAAAIALQQRRDKFKSKYERQREATKALPYHKKGWEGRDRAKRKWYGEYLPKGRYPCCGSQELGVGGCPDTGGYTMAAWDDSMWAANGM